MKAKTLIRTILQDLETEALAALQLGGCGEWMFTSDVIDLIKKRVCFGKYGLGKYEMTETVTSKLIREFSFPRKILRLEGRYMMVII